MSRASQLGLTARASPLDPTSPSPAPFRPALDFTVCGVSPKHESSQRFWGGSCAPDPGPGHSLKPYTPSYIFFKSHNPHHLSVSSSRSTDEKTEAQRGYVPCLRSQSQTCRAGIGTQES